MIAEPRVRVHCAVCREEDFAVVCAEREIRSQLAYLRAFHQRRLRRRDASAMADRADFTQDYATDVVSCRGCGLVYRNPRPTASAIMQAYEGDEYGAERLESLFDSQLALYRPRARLLALRLSPGARVIEVGSFVGGFLAAGREAGLRTLGVDPGEEVAGFCAGRGLPVFRGTLPEAAGAPDRLPPGWVPGQVDCVAIWNAFDQLPDPEPVLGAARELLRPGGLLALRVPNGACFRLAAAGMRRLRRPLDGWLRALLAWNNLLAFPYLYGYSVPTLDRLLARHGLVRVDQVPDTLCRLADDQTRTWAAVEEWALKRLARLAACVEARRPGSRLALAPWLDAYYRVA